jgi:hypothetical protein
LLIHCSIGRISTLFFIFCERDQSSSEWK